MSTILPFSYKCPAWGNTIRITTQPELTHAQSWELNALDDEDRIKAHTPQRVDFTCSITGAKGFVTYP